MTRRIRGAIFDIDGTLINSNDAHARAWVDALVEANIDVPFQRVRRMIGMGGDKLIPELTGASEDSTLGTQLAERRGEIFDEKYLPKIRPFPKSRELFEALGDAGIALAVASSAQKKELKTFLDIAGVRDLIEDATSSGDAERSKPDPDIVQAALDRIGLTAEDVIMVGDTPYDVEAATRAGIRPVAVRCGGWADADLAGAIAIYDGPADILEHLDELLNRL